MGAVEDGSAHYTMHVRRIVFLAKLLAAENWQSLSIPRGESQQTFA